jgi:two-component system, OmpR family, sensor histidine kinase MtrB
MRYFDWRGWLRTFTRLWRSSLQLRTVAITVLLSTLTVTLIGVYMSISVGSNLFDSRLNQILATSARATIAAQDRLDAAEESDVVDLESTMLRAFQAASQASTTTTTTAIAILRSPNQSGSSCPVDQFTPGLKVNAVISADLRKTVEGSTERRGYSQSVALTQADNTVKPGVVVGSLLNVPGCGEYSLFQVYDLSDTRLS